ncbi:MAG: hypothetical protein HN368_15110 [Spirochaetales bacterium]|jgi:hypothetical protein|nr:hypothetical protein [Spirochaetales bacterium]
MYLTVIIPPSNIRTILAERQTSLFIESFSPAALFLPPHIPLVFSNTPPSEPKRPLEPQKKPFESVNYSREGEHIFLQVAPEEQLADITRLLKVSPTEPYFPTRIGVPIGLYVPNGVISIDNLPAPPKVRWGASTLVCFELSHGSIDDWWNHVETHLIWKLEIKKLR